MNDNDTGTFRGGSTAPLLAALIGLSAGFGCGSDSPPATVQAERVPRIRENAGINVLLLTVDTLRADHLSAYGYPRETSPNIDALAARGVVFDNAYTYWPKTRGSFAAMFTSLYASQNGLTVRDRDLPLFNQTLAEVLASSGYQTAAAIDNPNLDRALGFAQGFERYEQTWLQADSELERTEIITRFGETYLEAFDLTNVSKSSVAASSRFCAR